MFFCLLLQALCDAAIVTPGPIPEPLILQLLTASMTHTRSFQLHLRALAALAHLLADRQNCSVILLSGGLYRIAAVMAACPDVPDIQHAALNVCALMKMEPDTGYKKVPDAGYGSIAQAAFNTLASLPALGDVLIHRAALDELTTIAKISSKMRDNVSNLPGLFQLIGSYMDTHATLVEMLCSAQQLLVSIAPSPPAQAVLSTPAWLHRLKHAIACYRDSFELQYHACTVLLALPPLSDALAKIVLPAVIAAVQAHPQGRVQSVGYGFLVKYKHLRATFDECEGGAEVHGITVSCCITMYYI